MRLIDADELSKWISGQSKSPSCPKNESAFGLRIMKHIDRMSSVHPEKPDFEGILEDYHKCIAIYDCENCKAFATIVPHDEGGMTYCDFLREHRKYVEDKLTRAMDNSL